MKEWVFDIDGVITNLETRKVEHPQILEQIAKKLRAREPVGFITGREFSWLQRVVLAPMEGLIDERGQLDLLHIECEFGGISVVYQNGVPEVSKDENFSLPANLLNRAREIVNADFNDVVFDPGKETHFTAELKPGIGPSDFGDRKDELAERMRKAVEEMELSEDIEVHTDALAVNVKNKKLNKHLAADKFLNWLETKGVEPEIFYVFGDSVSDLQIAEEIYAQGRNVVFIYTGKDALGSYPFEIIRTTKPYDKGTLEYLLKN